MTTTDKAAKDCTTCRYNSTYRRPKITDATGFGDQLMFEDTDETVNVCRSSGARSGLEHLVPVECADWAATQSAGQERLREIDEMIARRERRTSGAGKDGE